VVLASPEGSSKKFGQKRSETRSRPAQPLRETAWNISCSIIALERLFRTRDREFSGTTDLRKLCCQSRLHKNSANRIIVLKVVGLPTDFPWLSTNLSTALLKT
jgi:hypothetical protein